MHTHRQQVKLQITTQGLKQLIKIVQTFSRKKSLTNTVIWEKLNSVVKNFVLAGYKPL